ncbi:hypothetical protein BGZ73_005380 [Actinomortierella ambigua]|nr:hypothetical protein BGZ73_005380 [Actinomortierella ambigua]
MTRQHQSRQLRSRHGRGTVQKTSTLWVPDVALADAIKVTKKHRLSEATGGSKGASAKRKASIKEAQQSADRWTMPRQRQKHDDRPHQDAVMAAMPELCAMIAEYLTNEELTALVQVCQEWHDYWTGYLYRRVTLNKHMIAIGMGKLRFDLYGPFVETLTFKTCDDSDVAKVFRHDFPNLRSVDLVEHVFTSAKVFKAVIRSMPSNLRRLKMFCFPSSYAMKGFQQEMWPVLSSMHELFPEMEELTIKGYTFNSFGLLILLLKNMPRLRVLEFPNNNNFYNYRTQYAQNKFAHLNLDHDLDWTNPSLESLDLSFNMIFQSPKESGSDKSKDKDKNDKNDDVLSTPLGRLQTFFRRVPKLRRLTIDSFDNAMTQQLWHEGVLRYVPLLESLTANINYNANSHFNVSEALQTFCPRLTSVCFYRAMHRFGGSMHTQQAALDDLPPRLEHLTFTGLTVDDQMLKHFVENSSPRHLSSSAATGSARLPIPISSSALSVPPDTLCHTLRRLNFENTTGMTAKGLLQVLDHCSQLECLNLLDTCPGTLELFEDGRPWACANTLKALSMDLVRKERNFPAEAATTATATTTTAAGTNGGGAPALPGQLFGAPAAVHGLLHVAHANNGTNTANMQYRYELFSVHDLRRIRRRLMSLVALRALRLKGNLCRLTVISRGDYKAQDELLSTDLRERSNKKKKKQRRRKEEDDDDGGEDEDMQDVQQKDEEEEEDPLEQEEDKVEEEVEDDDDDDDVEMRRQRKASILEQLVWAKIDVEMYDIFEERSRRLRAATGSGDDAGGVGGAGGGLGFGLGFGFGFGFGGHGGLHGAAHSPQSLLVRETAILERWQAHHRDLDNVWYDYVAPRGQIREVFQFRKNSTTGWMAANLESEKPFVL